MNSKALFQPARYAHINSPKGGSALNTRSNVFICRYIECVTFISGKITSWVAVRGESGVAKVVGIPKFHSWGKCIMPLTNINSDWMSNASSGLCINLYNHLIQPQWESTHDHLSLQKQRCGWNNNRRQCLFKLFVYMSYLRSILYSHFRYMPLHRRLLTCCRPRLGTGWGGEDGPYHRIELSGAHHYLAHTAC